MHTKLLNYYLFLLISVIFSTTELASKTGTSYATNLSRYGTGLTQELNLINNTVYNLGSDSTKYGGPITNGRWDNLNLAFHYHIPTDIVDSSESANGGTVTCVNSMAQVASGVATTGTAVLKTKMATQYFAGHELESTFSACFTTGVANSTQWIGTFDNSDGFAIGYNGTQFSVLHRNALDPTAINTIISAANFNLDRLDGTGPSTIVLDPTKLNIYRITYGWLGAAPITFSILRNDGKWFDFHVIKRPNSSTIPSLSNPSLPIRSEVKKTAGTDNLIISSGSWNQAVTCHIYQPLVRTFQHDILDKPIDKDSNIPVFSIRNNITFNGKNNRGTIKLVFTTFTLNTATSQMATFKLIKNATLISTDWQAVDTNSIASYNDTQTALVTTGITQLTTFAIGRDTASQFLAANNYSVTLLPGETITVTVTTQHTNQNVFASLVWQEMVP